MTPEQAEKVRRLAACTMQPGSPPKRFVRDLAGYPPDQALTPRQAEWLDRLYHQYRKQLARFGPLPRWWTPGELLERGELEIGEEVRVDASRDYRIKRLIPENYLSIDLSGTSFYVAKKLDPLGVNHLLSPRPSVLYLHSTVRWLPYVGSPDGPMPSEGRTELIREDFPGLFDSLSELLDALYVATLREEPSRIPEVAAP